MSNFNIIFDTIFSMIASYLYVRASVEIKFIIILEFLYTAF